MLTSTVPSFAGDRRTEESVYAAAGRFDEVELIVGTVEDEADPSKVVVSDVPPMLRAFSGDFLFSMDVRNLLYDELITSRMSGKYVTSAQVPKSRIGVYNSLSSPGKVGMCYLAADGRSYPEVGSTTVWNGIYAADFSVRMSGQTQYYGFVKNLNPGTKVEGNVSFYSWKSN